MNEIVSKKIENLLRSDVMAFDKMSESPLESAARGLRQVDERPAAGCCSSGDCGVGGWEPKAARFAPAVEE